MGYCNNCGNQISREQAFCKHCGSAHTPETNQQEEVQQKRSGPRKMGMKAKVILISAAALFVVLIGTHLILSSKSTPAAAIDQFEKAVLSNDSKTVAAIVNEGQKRVKITENDAAEYIQFLTKDQDFSDISSQLREQSFKLLSFERIEPLTDSAGNDLIKLARGPKKWVFYDHYNLVFYPIEVTASSNLEKTVFYADGKEVKTGVQSGEPVSLGYYMPGTLKVKGKLKGEYSSFEEEAEADFLSASANILEVPLEMNAGFISIYSDENDAKLFVNGKATGKTIGETDSIGPVALDGSVSAYATFKNGSKTVKSEVIKIKDDSEIELSFNIEEPVEDIFASGGTDDLFTDAEPASKEDFEVFFDDYFYQATYAINARDFSLASHYFVPGSKAYQESYDYVGHLDEKGITEQFLGAEVIQVDEAPEGYYVQTKDSFTIYYGDGTSKDKTFHSKFYVKDTEDGFKIDTLMSVKEI
ncbi:hypothetical protein J9317_18455 [Metabacillus sp. KIGAM252]|uniref:Membrane-associated protein n=1 Tax=Metabacillus flavus TaxID=2823519 RepID=A0ABS5LK42_9BACI|nr:hypothetical protein [Metabacillus flavus]MBS2970729.1 hypothetical protein [Metabacillus flavus]